MGIKVKDKVVIELLHCAPSCCQNSRLGALVTVMFMIVTSFAKYRYRYRRVLLPQCRVIMEVINWETLYMLYFSTGATLAKTVEMYAFHLY